MNAGNDLLPNMPTQIIENIDSIEKKLGLVSDGMSEFQIRNFVIGSESSPGGKFKQCIVELRSRANSLELANIKRARLDLDYREISQRPEASDIDSKRKELDLKEKEIEQRENYRTIKRLEGEIQVLVNILGEFLESDVPLDEETYWEERLRRNISLNLALDQPLSINLIEAALNMPEESDIRKWMEDTLFSGSEKDHKLDIGDV